MDINASVDIGKNLTGLIEKLAAQIGTTADKVFPWYVQQAANEGLTTLIATSALLLLSVSFLIGGLVMVGSETREKRDVGGGMAFISGVVLVCVLTIGMVEAVEAARKLMNPNYYAMTMMTRDIGRMAGK